MHHIASVLSLAALLRCRQRLVLSLPHLRDTPSLCVASSEFLRTQNFFDCLTVPCHLPTIVLSPGLLCGLLGSTWLPVRDAAPRDPFSLLPAIGGRAALGGGLCAQLDGTP